MSCPICARHARRIETQKARKAALDAARDRLVEAALACVSAPPHKWDRVDDALRSAVAAYRKAKEEVEHA